MSRAPSDSETTVQTARLLWEACRPVPDPGAVRRALDGGADAPAAAAAAVSHRLVGMLWRALRVAGALDELGTERDRFEGIANSFRMEALLLVPPAVALAVQPLTDVGLEPVVFKGPAVASRYPEPGLRPMEDIDVLLPRGAQREALAVLERAGWRIARPGGPAVYDTVLSHPEVPSLYLELHHGLEKGTERVTTLDPHSLWMRRRSIDCAGTRAYGLSPSDELVVLAAHAGKPHHRFVRLIWLADLAMIAASEERLGTAPDWHAVQALAEEAGCRTVVGAALSMARRAGLDMPSELFPLPVRGWRGATMARLMSESWPLTHLELRTSRLSCALVDRVDRRMKLLLAIVASRTGVQRVLSRPSPPWSADVFSAPDAGDAYALR